MDLLKQLYKVHSPSHHEEPMQKFILAWLKKNQPTVKVSLDKAGNIYVTKGDAETFPCVVAHMDEVHDKRPAHFKVVVYKDNYILGGDSELLRPCGIGADDKNGIWVALKLLSKFESMKAAFFVGEEVGCTGSNRCDMKFFDDCRFVLQADRKGGSDFIEKANGVELCGQAFKSALKLSQFGYKATDGLLTDVMTLKNRGLKVACANVSCGYYNPHTVDEYTSFYELENCLAFFEHAFTEITTVQPHKHIPKYDVRPYSGYGGKYSMNGSWLDDDETDMPSRGRSYVPQPKFNF